MHLLNGSLAVLLVVEHYEGKAFEQARPLVSCKSNLLNGARAAKVFTQQGFSRLLGQVADKYCSQERFFLLLRWLGNIDSELLSLQQIVIQLECVLRLLLRLHVNKCDAASILAVFVVNDAHSQHFGHLRQKQS